jgi:hypothetical protein
VSREFDYAQHTLDANALLAHWTASEHMPAPGHLQLMAVLKHSSPAAVANGFHQAGFTGNSVGIIFNARATY